MSMALLILLLLAGGVAAWLAERVNADLPRWVSLATVLVALLYLLQIVSGLSAESFELIPDPRDGSSWLLHLKLSWIPRFGAFGSPQFVDGGCDRAIHLGFNDGGQSVADIIGMLRRV